MKNNVEDLDIRLLIHQSRAGCVIGKAGAKIKELREVSYPCFNNKNVTDAYIVTRRMSLSGDPLQEQNVDKLCYRLPRVMLTYAFARVYDDFRYPFVCLSSLLSYSIKLIPLSKIVIEVADATSFYDLLAVICQAKVQLYLRIFYRTAMAFMPRGAGA